MPSVGYRTNTKTRHQSSKDGKYRFLVSSKGDLEVLLMHADRYKGEIAKGVGAKKRVGLVERARELGVQLTNGGARLKSQETA